MLFDVFNVNDLRDTANILFTRSFLMGLLLYQNSRKGFMSCSMRNCSNNVSVSPYPPPPSISIIILGFCFLNRLSDFFFYLNFKLIYISVPIFDDLGLSEEYISIELSSLVKIRTKKLHQIIHSRVSKAI